MRFGRARSLGRQANVAAGDFASRVDDQTGEAARRATQVIVLAARVLRIPSAIVLVLPLPFVVATLLLALAADGGVRVVLLVVGLLMAAVSTTFAVRRRHVLRAVDDPAQLGTELGIAVSLSDKVVETRGALTQIAGGGGWRVFSRLKGLWQGAGMTGRWIDQVGDLPRAKYFVPPKIGTTVTLTVAALWLVPVSIVVTLFAAIGTLASSL